jgi:hypothetical protein
VAAEIRVIDMDIRSADRWIGSYYTSCRVNIENNAEHPEALVDEQLKADIKVDRTVYISIIHHSGQNHTGEMD